MLKVFTRRFVAKETNLSDPTVVQKEYDRLLERECATTDQLDEFISHWMELSGGIDDLSSRLHVAMTRNTADKEAESGYLHVVEKILPIVKKRSFEVKKLFMESPARKQLPAHYDVFRHNIENEIELFCEENIPLFTEVEKLSQKYQKISGSWMVDWEGEQLTVQKVRAKLEETDRNLREKAFRAFLGPHLADREKLDSLYDEMLVLRRKIAQNAGLGNYRDFAFRTYGRFDYSPEDCIGYHEAIKKHVVPLVGRLMERRKQRMGLDSLRPYDGEVDETGKAPVRPFKDGAELSKKVQEVFDTMDTELASYFSVMRNEDLLDLESRKGKAPGGYMTDFADDRLPFIFMNAVGTSRDVETLLHESGHAFHLFLCREIEPAAYLAPPMDFAEVASMSMEFLGQPYYEHIYKPEEIERVKTHQLVSYLKFLPFMAMIDAFQHWVYLSDSTPESRGDYWASLEDAYRPYLDWSGHEDEKRMGWQYLHVFQYPFYYIEYGIALLGALQVWRNSLQDYEGAIAAYKRGLALGGSRPLPQLFDAVDAKFDMTEAVLAPLCETLARELGV